jgi:hypothetical protein
MLITLESFKYNNLLSEREKSGVYYDCNKREKSNAKIIKKCRNTLSKPS